MPFPPRKPRKADFPTPDDLPGMDLNDASRALSALWRLCHADLAEVYTRPYTPEGERPRWNCWLEITQRRVELDAWVRAWLASQEDTSEGDGAA